LILAKLAVNTIYHIRKLFGMEDEVFAAFLMSDL